MLPPLDWYFTGTRNQGDAPDNLRVEVINPALAALFAYPSRNMGSDHRPLHLHTCLPLFNHQLMKHHIFLRNPPPWILSRSTNPR
jgi:hypothetical protein